MDETKEIITCEKHGDYEVSVRTYPSGKKTRYPKKCLGCVEADQRRAQCAELLRLSRLPRRFVEKTFGNYNANGVAERERAWRVATAYAESFQERLESGGCLIFCGKPGTGKTHLAAAITHHVVSLGYSVLFRSAIQAIRSVKETYGTKEKTEAQALADFYWPKLLILDEVGVQFGSEAERIILFEILNGRYENLLPTILISNLAENELSPYLGARVLDRMMENGGSVLAFTWDSYRRTQK